MPKRIQRKRTKGWRMPEGTVYVGRPSKWGNPHRPHALCYCPQAAAPAPCDDWFTQRGCSLRKAAQVLSERESAVLQFADDLLNGRLGFTTEDVRNELRGKDLACWCPLDQPCHADVLLEIANSEE